jgi:hypothetical protein
MRPERALGLLLFVCLTSLTPLAYASPPDPTWIEGMYDDADGDDIVVSSAQPRGSSSWRR